MNSVNKKRKTSPAAWIVLALIIGLLIWFIFWMNRQSCLSSADQTYWDYVKSNATDSKIGEDGNTVYTASKMTWAIAEGKKELAIDRCYK